MQRLGGAGQHALDEVVVELELGGDGVDHLALPPAHDLQPPHVVSVPGPVLAVARHLQVELIKFGNKTRELRILVAYPQNHNEWTIC